MTEPLTPDERQWIAEALKLPGGDPAAFIATVIRENPATRIVAVQAGPDANANSPRWFFKVCPPMFAYEGPLTQALADWFPADVPAVRAVDPNAERRWLLVDEAGPIVKTALQAELNPTVVVERWSALLRQFAQLQIRAIPRSGDLLALGVMDRRLATLPDQYAALVANRALLTESAEEGLTLDQLAEAQAANPRGLCDGLASYGIPETLHHDDFHVGNAGLRADGRVIGFRFFDWGETCLAHPFFSLFMSLRYAWLVFNADVDMLRTLRDAYLAPWAEHTRLPMGDLREAAEIAFELAPLCRALTWARYVQGLEGEAMRQLREENADAVPYWLRTFIHDSGLPAL